MVKRNAKKGNRYLSWTFVGKRKKQRLRIAKSKYQLYSFVILLRKRNKVKSMETPRKIVPQTAKVKPKNFAVSGCQNPTQDQMLYALTDV